MSEVSIDCVMTTYLLSSNEKRGGRRVGGTLYQNYKISLTSGSKKADFEINTGASAKLNDIKELKDEVKNVFYKFHTEVQADNTQ